MRRQRWTVRRCVHLSSAGDRPSPRGVGVSCAGFVTTVIPSEHYCSPDFPCVIVIEYIKEDEEMRMMPAAKAVAAETILDSSDMRNPFACKVHR
jgi:hypothetical protein